MSDHNSGMPPLSGPVSLGDEVRHSSGRLYRVTHITNAGSKIDGAWRYERFISYAQVDEPFKEYGRFEADFCFAMTAVPK